MNYCTDADRELVRRLQGMFVGSLTKEEIESFERCVKEGLAYREYLGASGFLGLAKVKIVS